MSVGDLVAYTLLVATQRGRCGSQQLEENVKAVLSCGASLVSHAIDEGFVRLAVAKRKAMERAQEQLSATSISAGGLAAPRVSAGEFEYLHHAASLLRSAAIRCKCGGRPLNAPMQSGSLQVRRVFGQVTAQMIGWRTSEVCGQDLCAPLCC